MESPDLPGRFMKLFGRRKVQRRPNRKVTITLTMPDLSEPVEMTGTTTVGASAIAALFADMGKVEGGVLERPGILLPEPENSVDANAVAVHVHDVRIGYVPGYIASRMEHRPVECQIQLWATPTEGGLRARGWVVAGRERVEWPHTSSNPPALTAGERRSERAASTSRMVGEAIAGGGHRAAQFKRGMVGDLHFLETVEPIKQLKREGRLSEALDLCYGAIEAAELSADGREPAPWYTEQAAIIHRKLGQRAEEEAVLRRWLDACPTERREGSSIKQRLDKLIH